MTELARFAPDARDAPPAETADAVERDGGVFVDSFVDEKRRATPLVR